MIARRISDTAGVQCVRCALAVPSNGFAFASRVREIRGMCDYDPIERMFRTLPCVTWKGVFGFDKVRSDGTSKSIQILNFQTSCTAHQINDK